MPTPQSIARPIAPSAAPRRCARRIGALAASAAVAAGAALGGCGGADDDDPASTPIRATCPSARTTTFDHGFLRTPARARPGRTPLLVVVLPGGHGDPDDALGVTAAAGRRAIAVLYPTRPRGFFWTLNRAQGSADVRRVQSLLDEALAGGCIDPDRVSITGVSNGAGFATRMSCEQPDRFAALVAIAAGYRALDRCPRRARTSFLAIHGSADAVVPYLGKPPDHAGSVPRYAARRAARDGCARHPATTRPRARVTRVAYRGCDAGLRVEILRLSGTTHGWPGGPSPIAGRNPSGVSATRELLRFVAGARRPAPQRAGAAASR
jgi:polyhydroxybutyrate depolymerase